MAARITAQRTRVENRRRRNICALDGVTLAGPDMGANGIRQTGKCQRVSVVNPQGIESDRHGGKEKRPDTTPASFENKRFKFTLFGLAV